MCSHFADKGPYSQNYGFSNSHVQMWELDHKEGWELKNWCFLIVVLEKTLESLLDSKEIQPVNTKGNQSWIFIGRTGAEAEAPVLGSPVVKSWLIGKDPDAGKDRGQEEKGTTEDKMVGWHHWLNGHEFEQTLGDGEGQGRLAYYSSWGSKQWDMTEWLSKNNMFSSSKCTRSYLPFGLYPLRMKISKSWAPLMFRNPSLGNWSSPVFAITREHWP